MTTGLDLRKAILGPRAADCTRRMSEAPARKPAGVSDTHDGKCLGLASTLPPKPDCIYSVSPIHAPNGGIEISLGSTRLGAAKDDSNVFADVACTPFTARLRSTFCVTPFMFRTTSTFCPL